LAIYLITISGSKENKLHR